MTKRDTFAPDWASNPGQTIRDMLEERQLPIGEFARQIGHAVDSAERLLQGETVITPELAKKLEEVLGGSANFWIRRDVEYRADLARIDLRDSTHEDEWLNELPIKDMRRFGWIPETAKSPEVTANACFQFFGVPDIRALRETYRDVLQRSTFRTSSAFESQPGAVAAWLRKGELESQSMVTRAWHADRFKAVLHDLRGLTRKKDPQHFVPELQRQCGECGVAVVIQRTPGGCRASGATRFLTDTKALLLLSFRHLSDDHFWFTFFHEAGHLLMHDTRTLFLEGVNGHASREEQEANDFAARILIPPQFHAKLLRLPLSGMEVVRFARTVGIAPGIVVGQLQYMRKIKQNQLNSLKRRFTWAE